MYYDFMTECWTVSPIHLSFYAIVSMLNWLSN